MIAEFINEYNTANGLVAGQTTLFSGQTQVNYDGVGTNGSFTTGSPYVIGDTITLTNSAVVTVTGVDVTGNVTNFTITTPGIATLATTATQLSTSGTGTGFSLTPGDSNLASVKTTVTGTELLSLLTDATQFIFDPVIGSFSFIPMESEFFADLSATPLDVFAKGYD